MGTPDQIVVPAESAEVVRVDGGRTFRIVAHEGVQVCDLALVDADDHEESYCSDMTVFVNAIKGTGNLSRVTELYSRPPGMKLLATVTTDRIGHHFPWAGGMCCSLLYDLRDDDPDHPNCADNLLAALREAGLPFSKVPEVFNLGMNVDVEDGSVVYREPEFGAGDFVEFRAERDLILGVSACPNDTTVINGGEPKSLLVEIDR